jgi:hypothetical protein
MSENFPTENQNINLTTQEMLQKNLLFIDLLISKLHLKPTQECQIKVAETFGKTGLEFNNWLYSIPDFSISNLSDLQFDTTCTQIIESNSLQLCVDLNLPRNLMPIIKSHLFEIIKSIVKLKVSQMIINNSQSN